jgi:hypothetical protein
MGGMAILTFIIGDKHIWHSVPKIKLFRRDAMRELINREPAKPSKDLRHASNTII